MNKLIQNFNYKFKQILFGLLGAILFSLIGIIIYYIAFYFNKNFGADDFSFFDAFSLFIVTFSIVYIINTFDVTNMLYKEYRNEFNYFQLFAKCFPRLVDLEWVSFRVVVSEIFVMLFTLSNYFRGGFFFIP